MVAMPNKDNSKKGKQSNAKVAISSSTPSIDSRPSLSQTPRTVGIPRFAMQKLRLFVESSTEGGLSEKTQLLDVVAQGSGNTTTTSEIQFEYVDYFDTSNDVAAPYFAQAFNTQSSLIAPAVVSRVPRRILGATLEVLPRFSLDSSSSSFIFLSTTPVATSIGDGVAQQAGNVRNTLIEPRADARWVQVGVWDAKQLFKDGTILPAMNSSGDMSIFSGVVLNPDTFDPIAANMQCRVTVRFAEQLPAASTLRIFHSNLVSVSSLYENGATASSSKVVLLRAQKILKDIS